MGKWTIGAGGIVVLCLALCVIVPVLVLPQVDLLDAAFHRDTAPVVIHHKTTSGLAVASLYLCHPDRIVLSESGTNETQIPQKSRLLPADNAVPPLRC